MTDKGKKKEIKIKQKRTLNGNERLNSDVHHCDADVRQRNKMRKQANPNYPDAALTAMSDETCG